MALSLERPGPEPPGSDIQVPSPDTIAAAARACSSSHWHVDLSPPHDRTRPPSRGALVHILDKLRDQVRSGQVYYSAKI
jgi:hypothetical protein